MKKIFLVLLTALLTSSCATTYKISEIDEDFIFSIQMTGSSNTGEVDTLHGVYVYLNDNPSGDGKEVFIAVFRNGKEVANFGGGSNLTYRILSTIRNANLPNIDYEGLVKDTKERFSMETGISIDILDGAEYEIKVNYEETDMSLRMWNLIILFEHIAEHDPILERLNSVIEVVISEVGKDQMGI